MHVRTLTAFTFILCGCTYLTSLDGWSFGEPSDAGMDASRMDAEARDAEAPDAQPSCAPGLIECSGTCVSLESSAEHCGACGNACPAPPGTVASCSSSECALECASGRGDCNETLQDGCEVDFEEDSANCGGCGIRCDVGLRCREAACRPQLVWARSFGSAGEDHATAMAFDDEGNVYVAGVFGETADFGAGALTSSGEDDAFLASYQEADGTPHSSLRLGGGWHDSGLGVAVNENRVCVTGFFSGTMTLGEQTFIAAGLDDAFIACFEPRSSRQGPSDPPTRRRGSWEHRIALAQAQTGPNRPANR